jgi:hypothetical protein
MFSSVGIVVGGDGDEVVGIIKELRGLRGSRVDFF